MDNRALGKHLKKLANPSGNFVKVDIVNVYNTLEVLSHFFYQKKHEWVAICFLDTSYTCKMIWFNKGPTHRTVPLKLSPQQAVDLSKSINAQHVIVAHNHPISSHDMLDYGSRRANIEARYQRKGELLDFSDVDISL